MTLEIRSIEPRLGGEPCLALDVMAADGLVHATVLIERADAEAAGNAKDTRVALEELVRKDPRFTEKAISDAVAEQARRDAIDVEMVALSEKLRMALAAAETEKASEGGDADAR